jgi:hypothetical protein
MAATPASKALDSQNNACDEGCAENDTACIDACTQKMEQACATDPAPCEKFVSCDTTCAPNCNDGTC